VEHSLLNAEAFKRMKTQDFELAVVAANRRRREKGT